MAQTIFRCGVGLQVLFLLSNAAAEMNVALDRADLT
jgi:hypothetical protein